MDKRLLASRWVGCNKPCNEQQEPVSCRLSLSDGLLRIGIVNEEPPYAEPHVRWCERSENEIGGKLLRFPPTRLMCSFWIQNLYTQILIYKHALSNANSAHFTSKKPGLARWRREYCNPPRRIVQSMRLQYSRYKGAV